MLGRRSRAKRVHDAIDGYAGSPGYEDGGEKPVMWGNFHTGEGSTGLPVTYAEKTISFTSLADGEQSVVNWKKAIRNDVEQWVENNAPGSEKDMLLAMEMPEGPDGMSGGVFVRWDTAGNTELYRYLLQKDEPDSETGIRRPVITDLTKLEVDSRTSFPAPRGCRMVMSVRGRASIYDGKQVDETPERQSPDRFFATALRDAVDAYKVENDPQLPKGTTRYSGELTGDDTQFLLKRYKAEKEGSPNILEAITGRTVGKDGGWVGYHDARNELDDADLAIQFRTPDSQRFGEYMVVFPPEEDGSRRAELVRRRADMHHVSLHIAPDGGTIVIGAKRIMYDPSSGEGIGQIPEGARIIASVRGFMTKGEAYDDTTFDPESRTPDERTVMAARQAMTERKTEHSS